MSSYPKDLIAQIQRIREGDQIFGHLSESPNELELIRLLETGYHASFLIEEGRRSGFRMAYVSPAFHAKNGHSKFVMNEKRLVEFSTRRQFTASELNRLAVVADLTRSIILVWNFGSPKSPVIQIWGILDEGDNWHRFSQHQASRGTCPPQAITITSRKPGELSISISGAILCVLREGHIERPAESPIWKGPLSGFLDSARSRFYEDVVTLLQMPEFDKDGPDDGYPQATYSRFLERILLNVRDKRHGGTILVVPDNLSLSDTRITDRLRVKYPCDYNYAWDMLKSSLLIYRTYYKNLSGLDRSKSLAIEEFEGFQRIESRRQEAEESLNDIANSIANLTGIDGAVLMTDQFRVLGFGAEVVAVSHSLDHVTQCSFRNNIPIPIEDFGTRHRSAFRFCSSFENAIAFVVSQDGGVKAVKREGAEVFFWSDVDFSKYGI